MASRRTELRYVPAQLLAGHPHVLVDGAPRPGTACCLSHWPFTPTPAAVAADLSAEIALRALDTPDVLPSGVDVLSIDHYDEDGLIALAILDQPALLSPLAPLLVEAARVGDFGVVHSGSAAQVAFALATLADPDRSPIRALRPPRRPTDALGVCSVACVEALTLLPDLARRPSAYRRLWHEELTAYDAARAALDTGIATVVEEPEHDLAVVQVDVSDPGAQRARWKGHPLHPAAVHSATACLRIATVAGRCFTFRYRYESWVRLTSCRPRPRVDLASVVERLDAEEGAAGRWAFDGASALTGALHLADSGVSTISPERFLEVLRTSLVLLDAAPPAWDPGAPLAPPPRT
jgi:hypothetical protein